MCQMTQALIGGKQTYSQPHHSKKSQTKAARLVYPSVLTWVIALAAPRLVCRPLISSPAALELGKGRPQSMMMVCTSKVHQCLGARLGAAVT